MASSWRQCPPRGPFHATLQREDDATATTTSPFPSLSRATSAAAAEGRDDASRPPPPAPAYEFSEEGAPSRSGETEESCSAAPLLPLATRTRANFTSNFAGSTTARSSADIKKASAALPSSASSSWAPGFSLARGGARKGLPEAGAQEGEISSSAATRVVGNGVERAATIPAPDAAASRSGTSGSTAHSPGALSSLAGGGQPSLFIAPRSGKSSPWMQDKQMSVIWSKNGATIRLKDGSDSKMTCVASAPTVPRHDIPLCICKCRDCSKQDTLASAEEEKPSAHDVINMQEKEMSVNLRKNGAPIRDCSKQDTLASAEEEKPSADDVKEMSVNLMKDGAPIRDLTAPAVEEFSVSGPEKVESSSSGYQRCALGSKYWDHYPASQELNPPGFFSPHPLWEGFAIPAKVGGKSAFHCVFCGKKFLGSADKGVKHMLRNEGCQISDWESEILVKKVDAYRKKKQDLVKRKRQDK